MYTCRRGIPEADGARGASLQELAGVWGIYFSVNDCRSVWLALIYILIVCMVLKTTCVCCERELNVWPQNFFSLQWNWNRFLSFFCFLIPLFTIGIRRHLSKISATVLSLQNMSSAICKYRIVWSTGRHYFQHNLSYIYLDDANECLGGKTLFNKKGKCLSQQSRFSNSDPRFGDIASTNIGQLGTN